MSDERLSLESRTESGITLVVDLITDVVELARDAEVRAQARESESITRHEETLERIDHAIVTLRSLLKDGVDKELFRTFTDAIVRITAGWPECDRKRRGREERRGRVELSGMFKVDERGEKSMLARVDGQEVVLRMKATGLTASGRMNVSWKQVRAAAVVAGSLLAGRYFPMLLDFIRGAHQ